MKRACLLFLTVLLAAAATAESAPQPFPRSLVSRLLDARDGSRAPFKRMWYAADEKVADADWTFDVARVEGLLEKVLVLSPDGTYRLKRDLKEENARLASNNALAYVNRVIAEWGVLQLDTTFDRCDAETIRLLGGYRVDLDPDFWTKFAIFTKKGVVGGGSMKAGGWITAWKITPALFLVLTNELGTEGNPRDYQFVMWDGKKDWPIVGFDSFPDANRVALVKRILTSAAAVNNLAVAIHMREANRGFYMADYVESLLRRAALEGCETAFHNLGVLMEEKKRPEEAAAFYSRERASSAKTKEANESAKKETR